MMTAAVCGQHAGTETGYSLRVLSLQEEIYAEKRINLVSLVLLGIFLLCALLLPLITRTALSNPNELSNLTGCLFLLVYHCILFVLLKRKFYHWILKYLTIFFSLSMVTIILYGYHFGTDFVHAARTVTVGLYFIVIILSGLYQHPKVSLFAGLLACLEYSLLFLGALHDGLRIEFVMETFQSNTLSWDILVVNCIFFLVAGILLFLISERQRAMMRTLQDSSLKLHKEREEHRLSEQKAVFLENFDELTGLPNFKQFKQMLGGQIRKSEERSQIFALICLNLDAFSSVNLLHGTEIGDQVLHTVGERLKAGFREGDFVSRFMGDKFLVFCGDLKSNYNISDLIRKARASLNAPIYIDGARIKLSASAGLCTYPNDAHTAGELIKKAESAMYDARRAGKNNFLLFNRDNQKELEERIVMERELHDALAKNEFSLVYQPKVDVSGSIAGLEALLRWKNPLLGQVSPAAFIPIAELSGAIVPIGYAVLRNCCLQIREWMQQGIRPFRTTVNVSPYQFARKDIIEKIRAIINETGIDPIWLGIEITESGIMIDEDNSIRKLNALKEMGLSISLDDFDKGYSSLSRLGTYPLDTLKIDKSFIDDLPESSVSTCIVRSIIDLAHNLNYNVVAEGVETQAQVEFLQNNGCARFQGYYYYKPMTAGELEPLFARIPADTVPS
jgi:diguanylate cyclase (GGDEF)-like protein